MDYKIIINAHRGGEDIGIIYEDLKAKDLNLEIAEYLSKRLVDHKIPNQLIRESDETINLKDRVKFIEDMPRNNKYIILLSIDVTFGKEKNIEVFHSLKNDGLLAKIITKEISNMENYINESRNKRLPVNPTKDYNFLQRESQNINSVVVKFTLKKESDMRNLKVEIQKYSEMLIKAITTYLGGLYSPEIKKGEYKIIKGDTLWSVAKKHGITVDEIKALNNLKNNSVSTGQIIKVEEIVEVEPIEIKENVPKIKEEILIEREEIIHSVQETDTIYKIADYYGVNPNEIKEANNLISDEINYGQILLIPNKN